MVSGIRENPPPEATLSRDYKLLVDEVFVISRKIKVEVGVISRSERLRLITINSTFMILDIIKPHLIIVLLHNERRKNGRHVYAYSLTASNTKHANLT